MRRFFYACMAMLALAATFVASPIVTAWTIREAIRTGNSTYLEGKLEWDTVRMSLRASMIETATGIPEPSPIAAKEVSAQTGSPRPGSRLGGPEQAAVEPKLGLWQRIKNGVSRRAVDGIVARYVTPERLSQLFTARQFYRDNISGETAALEALPWTERVAGFWQRIRRAEFHSPTVFELEMADRNDPTRHYIGLLRLRGFEWKLTELRVRLVPATDPA
jgi:hypothetical protein